MEITKTILSYEKVDETVNKVPVIIVAAGNSTRMQGTDKQFLEVGGIPVLARTISKFQMSDVVKSIIVVTKESDILKIQNLCEQYSFSKVSDIVAGGQTRTLSVKCGLSVLEKGEKYVLIHDGGRPFVTKKMIDDVVKALRTSDCAIIAKQSTDTVKMTDKEATILKTIDRKTIYLAQTPQGVNVNKFKFALNSVKDEEYTDDASIMEKMGYKCVVCEGSATNIKITTPNDIAVASAIAQAEDNEL